MRLISDRLYAYAYGRLYIYGLGPRDRAISIFSTVMFKQVRVIGDVRGWNPPF